MIAPILIDPNAVYDDGAVQLALDIPSATLIGARRSGRLRFTRKGRRVLYLGTWILEWLADDATSTCRKEVASE